jgi:hypothetical protein
MKKHRGFRYCKTRWKWNERWAYYVSAFCINNYRKLLPSLDKLKTSLSNKFEGELKRCISTMGDRIIDMYSYGYCESLKYYVQNIEIDSECSADGITIADLLHIMQHSYRVMKAFVDTNSFHIPENVQ